MRTAYDRLRVGGLLALSLLLAGFWPASAWAQCGVTDLGACVDDAQYNFWYGLAATGWSIDRTLLSLTYQLDQFRWWLISVAFTSAYQVLIEIVSPFIVPFATLAVVLGCLLFLLVPLLGRINIVNIRHALIWAILAPLLLTLSGPLIVQLEQLRTELGATLFSGASDLMPGAIFGPAGTDMRSPIALYPANPCGGGTLARPSGSPALAPDDLAAAALWANAQDIHCPDTSGPSPDIPDSFYEAAPIGPGYAYDGSVGEMQVASDRAAAIASMQRGATRLYLGMLPCLLAVLNALVQLFFGLCLVVLWVGLPIGLLFVFFQQTASGVSSLFRRAISVLQISWSSSFVLGMIAASLQAAAQLRNATAYSGFAVGAIVLTGYFLFVAIDTLKDSIRTLNDTIALTTGLSLSRPFELAGQLASTTAGVAAGVATGGAAMALTGLAARQQSGSNSYAAAAAAGRIRPVARLGEVLTTMGALDSDGEIARGLYAGERSQRSWRAARLQMRADAGAPDADGQTMRDRAEDRRLVRALARADQPTLLQRDRAALAGLGDQVVSGLDRAGTGLYHLMGDDGFLGHPTDRIVSAVGDRWQSLVGAGQDFARDIAAQVGTPSSQPVLRALQTATAAATVLNARLGDHRYAAFRWNDRRLMMEDRQPATDLPPNAQVQPSEQVDRVQLLRQGYTVQNNPDGTTTFWIPNRRVGTQNPARLPTEDQTQITTERLVGAAPAPAPSIRLDEQRELDEIEHTHHKGDHVEHEVRTEVAQEQSRADAINSPIRAQLGADSRVQSAHAQAEAAIRRYLAAIQQHQSTPSPASPHASDLDATPSPVSQAIRTTQVQLAARYLADLADIAISSSPKAAMLQARGIAQATYHLEQGRPDDAARAALQAVIQLQHPTDPPPAGLDRDWPTTHAELDQALDATTRALNDMDAAVALLTATPPPGSPPDQIAANVAALDLRQRNAQARLHAYQAQRGLLQGLPEGDADA